MSIKKVGARFVRVWAQNLLNMLNDFLEALRASVRINSTRVTGASKTL